MVNKFDKKLLWKYLGVTDVGFPRISFLNDKLFRITQPSALNDPFEMKPRVILDQYAPEDWELARKKALKDGMPPEWVENDEELEAMYLSPCPAVRFSEKTTPGLWPAYLKEFREEPFSSIAELDAFRAQYACKQIEKVLDATIGVFSLSRNPAQLLMWSHYGAEHRGIAVGFDPQHSFFHTIGVLSEVRYKAERVSVSMKDGTIRIAGKVLQTPHPPIDTVIRKGKDWCYEQEFRFIVALANSDTTKPGVRDGEVVYLLRFPPSVIKCLVFGARVPDAQVEPYKLLINDKPEWSHLRLLRAKLSSSEFSLVFDEV